MSRPVSVHSMQGSRDPAGLDPSGIDVVAGADPPPDEYREGFEADPPILPPTAPSAPPPPTPRRTHPYPIQQQHGVRAPSPVMAFLVGEPPPPPPTPPPHKQRGAASTRRQNTLPVSPPGDASTTTGFSSLSSSLHPRREPREPLMDANMMSFVDQKRREALAIYESPNLYMHSEMDDSKPIPPKFQPMPPPKSEHTQMAQEFGQAPQSSEEQAFQRFAAETRQNFEQLPQKTYEPRRRSVVNTGPVDLDDDPFDPINSLASPRSAVTEPHSNKRTASRRGYKRTGSQESVDNQSSDSQSSGNSNNPKKTFLGDGTTPKKRRGRMSTGSTKVPKVTEKRGRGRSVERAKRGETPEREKKGFFGKIFGRGKKKNTEGPTTNAKSTKQEEPTPVKRKAAKVPKAETVPLADLPVLPPKPATSNMSAHSAPHSAPQAEYNELGNSFIKTSGAPSVGSKAQSTPPETETMPKPKERPMQLDTAPSDDAKELDLGMGLDTVTSGLTNDMEPDRRDIFFAHDEVSTLTAPSANSYSRRSVDPVEGTGTVTSGNSSEPVGHYWNSGVAGKAANMDSTPKVASPIIDPFNEPFFREPDGESPITSSKTVKAKTKLQVDVPNTKDPVGETPPTKHSASHMNEPSPRGWESPITELKDPLGSTISDSGSKRTAPGFGHAESASKPKIPPSSQSLTNDLRREPSAFRDGSPYALDPPLRVHEGEHEEGTKEAKSVVGILTQVPPKASRVDRIAVEPPTAILSVAREEVQPPTPSTVRSEPVLPVRSAEPKQKENTENQAVERSSEEEPPPSLPGKSTSKSPLIKRTTPVKPAVWSPEKVKVNSSKKTEPDSPDATGFLDDLFQEKPTTRKRPSIVRPISINVSESAARRSATKKLSSSQTQVIEIHRTQRLSGSPRSNKAAPWNAGQAAAAEAGLIAPLPVEVPGSPKADEVVSHRIPRLRRALRDEEEEKKEQDHDKPAEEPKSKFTTSTAALSTAVIQNAKTVAYLHTLNGEPSPRHAWRRADLSDDEYSPVKSGVQRKAASNVKAAMSKKRAVAVNSDEDAFDSFISSGPAKAPPSTKARSIGRFNGFGPVGQATAARLGNARSSKSLIVASMSKHSRSQPAVVVPNNSKLQLRNQYGAHSPRSRKTARENFRRPLYLFRFNRDVRVTGAPLTFGLDLIRKKRIEDILNGYVVPVYKDKSIKTKKPPPPAFQCLQEDEIKDPIQRAGRRLLSKAAVPIQSAARRYLALRQADGRAQANVVLQSYFRRWKCEAFLIAYKFTCIKIQAAVRSWLVRCEIAYEHYHATQIQKVVRGYIAAAYVYDTIYWVSKVQAAVRGKLARNHFAALKDLRQQSALLSQAWFRGCLVRQEATKRREAICSIQAIYRSYRARTKYQVQIVDIIITQSVVRKFLSRKEAEKRLLVKMNAAARKIQATWRGFQGYTDYIFALVDILVLQRSMRKWLAKKRVNSMRRERAAIRIQAQWRRQTALIGMLYDLVHIIIAQSVARRFLARKMIPQKRREYSQKMKHHQMLDTAATKIQTAWRGFWGYSHFIIMQYEIIRLQAIIRGRASRILFSLKLGCCIMIQSAARRYLSSKKTYNMKLANAALGGQVEAMRMKFACRKVQFWWRVVMECSREKKAALIIERFFCMVKAEVDKEIIRQREIQMMKERERELQIRKQRSKLSIKSAPQPQTTQQPQRKKDPSNDAADEKLLEKVFLDTVSEDRVEVLACSSQEHPSTKANKSMPDESNKKRSETKGRSRSAPRLHQNPSYVSEPSRETAPTVVKHHPSSPTMNLVMRHENDPTMRRELELRARKEEALKASRRIQLKSNKLPQDVTLAKSASELSAITSPTVFTAGTAGRTAPKNVGKRPTKSSKQPESQPKHSTTFEDDLSLEESLLGEDIVETTTKSQGMQSAPHQKGSKKNHFFSDEAANPTKRHHSKGKQSRRRHSTSSIASEVSCTGSEDASDIPSHMYSRTATTISRTTASRTETLGSGSSPQSDCKTEVDMRRTVNQNLSSPLVDRRYGADKYTMSTTTGSAALKGKKLIESFRGRGNGGGKGSSGGLSPRHGQIVVTNVPILSQDSRDNVEVEYGGGEQFGLI